ncbi:MAG: DNA primase [Gammaproteobacteria bacterium]|nr:DNA primase [Gammaproteobacteria bacterium]
MAGLIPQDFIDDLIDRTDIVEVIGSRVQLKKAGREYKSPCPFHNEKTPSFTVSPQKGFYHCFGCGAHGTVLSFLLEFDRLEFPEAVEELAHIAGLTVPRDEQAERSAPTAPIYEILTKAAKIYQRALKDNPPAIEYLKGRGLSGETVREFGVGYAPGGWDFLLRQFPDREDVQRDLLSAGLIAPRDSGGFYDRFRERIIFPIRDGRGRVVAFGGRITGDGEPKYLNSPETAVFHKGRELYGLYEARRAARDVKSILVVEGYMDTISLANHDVRNAVATLGTATTHDHLTRLFRATRSITFCFDGDRAGREAAWRALQTSLAEMRDGRQVSFLFLDDGEDPDSLICRDGTTGFQAALQGKLTLSDYLFRELKSQVDTATMDGRATLAELARPLVELVPEGVYKELLTERLAQVVGLGRHRLAEVIATPPATVRKPSRISSRPSLVRQAIETILNHPQTVAEIKLPAGLDAIDQKGMPLLLELIGIAQQKPDIKPAGILERFRGRSECPHLEALLAADSTITDVSEKGTQLTDCLQRIIDSSAQQRLAVLVTKAQDSSLTADEKDEFRRLSMYSKTENPD